MQQFSSLTRTPKEEKQFMQLLEQFGVAKKIAKGNTIIREGEKSNFFVYVINGGFKSYISKGDREYILGFSFADNIDCCPYALFAKKHNTYTLEAYTDTEIIKVNMRDVEKFSAENRDMPNFIFDSLVDYIGIIENSLFDLISKTAEERYIDLVNNYKNQIDLISLSDIAKYLGVTLERVSRIRKKIGT